MLFTSKDVAALLGITSRDVKNYSDVSDYKVHPLHVGLGIGSRRLYSELDVIRIAFAERLREKGFTPRAIGELLDVAFWETRKALGLPDTLVTSPETAFGVR